MILFTNVSKKHPAENRYIFKELTLKIDYTEKYLIKGSSGSGKSLFTKLITGEVMPDSGEVFVFGKNLKKINWVEFLSIRRQMGIVPQQLLFFENLSVWDNISYPLVSLKIPQEEIFFKVTKMIGKLNLFEHKHTKLKYLSYHQRFKVALARALINNPPLLLIDEVPNFSWLSEFLKEYSKLGITMVFTSSYSFLIPLLNPKLLSLD